MADSLGLMPIHQSPRVATLDSLLVSHHYDHINHSQEAPCDSA